jgi:hypothetical protein
VVVRDRCFFLLPAVHRDFFHAVLGRDLSLANPGLLAQLGDAVSVHGRFIPDVDMACQHTTFDAQPRTVSAVDSFRLLPFLAKAARAARLQAGVSEGTVAGKIGVKEVTIERFEELADVPPKEGESKWPLNPDRHVAAYADAVDCKPAELWQVAIDLAEGRPSELGEGEHRSPPRPDFQRHLPPGDDEALDESA